MSFHHCTRHVLGTHVHRSLVLLVLWLSAAGLWAQSERGAGETTRSSVVAATAVEPSTSPWFVAIRGDIDTASSASSLLMPPAPADVLTPNLRRNTPYLKVALRLGGTYTAFSNDRYLDNTPLDVGRTSGETAIYTSAGAFGYGGGVELEYPLNTGLSLIGTIDYQRARFSKEGPVSQACTDSTGDERAVNASHEFRTDLHYLRLGAAIKISFTSLYLVGGLTASPLLYSSLYRERRILDANATCLLPGSRREIVEDDPLPDPSGLHYSFRVGVGRSYQIGERWQFSPELMIDFGLNQINKSPESDIDIYSFNAVIRYELR